MGTNLHSIRFPVSTRSQRIKTLLDLRKTKRSQVFRNHRLRFFLASDERIRLHFQAICHHLNTINHYSDEQKLTAILWILYTQTPQIIDFIRMEMVTKLIKPMNADLHKLTLSICHLVDGIDANDIVQHDLDIGARFECDNLTFPLNVNSISDLMVELLSLLLQNVCNRFRTVNISVSQDFLYMFVLCYKHFGNNRIIVERNLHTIQTLTQGCGRFERTKAICEYEPLVKRLLCQHVDYDYESLIVLKIINNMTNGFAENIERLRQFNLLSYLRNHLINANQSSYAVIEQCLNILENICGNHRSDIQAIIDAHLIDPIIQVFKSTDSDINLRKIAINIFHNISSLGSIEQIKSLLDLDLLHLLCRQLHFHANFNDEVIDTILETIHDIVRYFYKMDHRTYHQLTAMINVCGGFTAIGQLINHNDESISSISLQLSKYANNECVMCSQGIPIDWCQN